MKQFLTFALFILPIMLFSSNIDISKSKGTTQEIIVQLMPYPQQEDVSRYIEISASFNIPLYAKHIKKFDVKLKYICENEKHEHKNRHKDDKKCKKKKNIKGEVRYIKSENRVTFRPSQVLASGVYEVEYKSIKADKSNKHTKIKEIKYRFVVEEKVLESSTILPSNIHLIEGEISQLTITGKYDNGIEKDIISQVEWIVGDSQTISIDDKGLVTALKAGDTTIQAKLIGVVEVGEVVSNEVQVEVLIPDIVPPVITLNGEETIILHQNANYQELGAVAVDERDGEVNVTVIGAVDTTTVGSYIVIYTAIDSIGNEANITRNVTIIDVTPPTITLNGDANITLKQNEYYIELGATAFDIVDGNISVEINGEVDTSIVGSYTVTYLTKDNAGNEAIDTRTVNVVAPKLTLISISLESNVSILNIGDKADLRVIATYSNNSTKELNMDIEWLITPVDSVEMSGNMLIAKKESNVIVQAKVGSNLSNTLNLTIAWIVNGHLLPPEPDKTLNDSTLLGIDVNGNGVRDDVERYIYSRFMQDPDYPKTKTALAMQYAWSTQKVLESPVIESDKYYADALACQSYWMNTKTSSWSAYDYMKFSLKHKVFDEEHLTDKIFNTKERVLRDFEFNKACSGNIFGGSPKTIDSCQTDISILGE